MSKLIRIPKGLKQADKPFFNRVMGRAFDVKARDEITEIDLYDEIGFFGVTAQSFKMAIKDAKDIKLNINSPGGDIFDGIAIYNDLLSHRRKSKGEVDVEITGVAASAASVIAMAGDSINIAKNGFIMIHNAWGMTIGNKNDHEKMRGVLEKIDGQIAGTYSDKTGISMDDVLEMMNDETWFTGEEAVDQGFADEMLGEVEAKARFDLTGMFKHTPDGFNGFDDIQDDSEMAIEMVERNIGILV